MAIKFASIRPTLGALLVAALVAAGLGVGPAAAFDDVPDGRFFTEPVNWMAEAGITTGRTASLFDPDAPVTRGEVATFLWRFAHEPVASSSAGFADVPAGKFYSDAVDWLAETEITTGRTAALFAPEEPVTRGEVATFVWRYACEPDASSSAGFADVPANKFYRDAIDWMFENDITTGRTAALFAPEASVTRGEVATFVWRYAGKPATAAPGSNRVTLAPLCDGTPPPPPPGVGNLTVSTSSLTFGDAGVSVGSQMSVTLTNSGGTGSPNLIVTAVGSNDASFTPTFIPASLEPGASVVVPVDFVPSELGVDSGTLTVSHAGANGPASLVALSGTGVPGTVHKVNAGGSAVADWTADTLLAPSVHHNMVGSLNKVFEGVSPIAGAAPDPESVFQTARTDHRSSDSMEWDLPVPVAGYHLVTLYFAQLINSHQEVDVRIEGSLVLDRFNPGAVGGINSAVRRSFVVESDTNIDIDVAHSLNIKDTFINGIEVSALGTQPDGYVTVAPSPADFGGVATAGGVVMRTITVTNVGTTPIVIPAPVVGGDFASTSGSLNLAARSSGTFDVDFDPASDGLHTQWVELVSPGADVGVQLVGFGGAGTTATVDVLPAFTTVDATVFDVGSIIIRNTSATESITSVSFDLAGALLDDLSFDPMGGDAIAEGERDWLNSFSPLTVASQSGVDGQSYTVNFTGFAPGQSAFGSIDIDPLSSLGEPASAGPERAATINGLELVGTAITVTFSGGGTATTVLRTDGTGVDSRANLSTDAAPPLAPVVSMLSGALDGSTGAVASQTVNVTCVAGQALELVHVEAELLDAGGTGPLPVGGNRILGHVLPGSGILATGTCGGGGTFSFPAVTLQDSTPGDNTDGWNHFLVLQGDEATGLMSSSGRFSVRYET